MSCRVRFFDGTFEEYREFVTQLHARMQQAVAFLDLDRLQRARVLHVALYGEGGVRLENGSESRRGEKAVLELNTRGEFKLNAHKSKVAQRYASAVWIKSSISLVGSSGLSNSPALGLTHCCTSCLSSVAWLTRVMLLVSVLRTFCTRFATRPINGNNVYAHPSRGSTSLSPSDGPFTVNMISSKYPWSTSWSVSSKLVSRARTSM